jgi:hypothetical protein
MNNRDLNTHASTGYKYNENSKCGTVTIFFAPEGSVAVGLTKSANLRDFVWNNYKTTVFPSRKQSKKLVDDKKKYTFAESSKQFRDTWFCPTRNSKPENPWFFFSHICF